MNINENGFLRVNAMGGSFSSKAVAEDVSPGRALRISLEGNIASGKTTLLRGLATHPWVVSQGYRVSLEPVDEWHSELSRFCMDRSRWSLLLNMRTMLSQFQSFQEHPSVPLIQERSYHSAWYVFTHALQRKLEFTEIRLLRDFDDYFKKAGGSGYDIVFYLRASPEKCIQRLRARETVDSEMDIAYLRNIHCAHETWLMDPDLPRTFRVCVLDGEANPEAVLQQAVSFLQTQSKRT